jgi:hypothetical protein
MKANRFHGIWVLSFFWVVLASSSWAGQVVTKEAKQWAKNAVTEEKTLQASFGRNTAGVLYFQNKTGQAGLDPLQKGLALMLTTDLSSLKKLQMVERIRLQALVEEMGLGASGLVDPDTAPRVGKLLGAQWIVGGDFAKAPAAQFEIRSHLLDTPNLKIVGQPRANGDLPDFFRMEKDLLLALIKLFRIELTPKEEEDLMKPFSTKIEALLLLSRGIDASDRRDYQKAAEFYDKALREDPDIPVAAEALKELQALSLIAGKKRSRELLRGLRDETSLTDQLTPAEPLKRERTPKDVSPGRCENCPPFRTK